MPHTFRFYWDMNEHIRASRAVSRNLSKGRFRIFLSFLPVFAMVLAATVLFGPSEGRLERVVAIVPWLLVLGFWFLLLIWGLPYLTAWRFKRNDPSAKSEMFRTIGEDGIQAGSSISRIELKWAGIVRAVETSEFFLFYYNQQCAYYLPKRAVPTSEELREVRSIVAVHLASKATLLA